jgi:hypothetical protein
MEGRIFFPLRRGDDTPPPLFLEQRNRAEVQSQPWRGVFKGLLQSSLAKGGDLQVDSRSEGRYMAERNTVIRGTSGDHKHS